MAILRSRSGQVINSELTTGQVLHYLRCMPDNSFARGLVSDLNKYGSWTEEKRFWAHHMANQARLNAQSPTNARTQLREQLSQPVNLPAPVPVQAPDTEAILLGQDSQGVKIHSNQDPVGQQLASFPPEVKALVEQLATSFGISLPGQPTSIPAPRTEPAPVPVEVQTPAPVVNQLPSLAQGSEITLGSKVFELFDKAKSKLVRPKIHFGLAGEGKNRREVILSIAGPKSSRPGVINVTSEGGYGSNDYYGYISRDGVFHPYSKCDERVMNFLTAFAEDPVGYARAYGKRTGYCIFCGDDLTTTREANGAALYSADLGYGKRCAQNWGLPYGLAAATPEQKEAAREAQRLARKEKAAVKKASKGIADALSQQASQ